MRKLQTLGPCLAQLGPAAAFKGLPRGCAGIPGPEVVSALRLRNAQSQRTASENASRQLGGGWACQNQYANEGAEPTGKNRLCLWDLEETRRNPQPLSTSSDVVDVPFKSGRAGAVRGNANLGCYTTAGGLFSPPACPPGSLSAPPPPSPPQLLGESRARGCRRRLLVPLGNSVRLLRPPRPSVSPPRCL